MLNQCAGPYFHLVEKSVIAFTDHLRLLSHLCSHTRHQTLMTVYTICMVRTEADYAQGV